MMKKFEDMFVSKEYTNVTDRQTDGQRETDGQTLHDGICCAYA